MSSNNSSSPMSRLIPILLIFAGLIGLFYLYQYLFGARSSNSYPLVQVSQDASPSAPIVVSSDKLPVLYEGGEFTITTWFYINNWSVPTRGIPKYIMSVGGKNFRTIRIYLGGSKPKLHVRLTTRQPGAAVNSSGDQLDTVNDASIFTVQDTDSGLLDSSPLCDLPEVDLQRWVNLTVAVNGKTVDVYLDGKLSRSCVMPFPFRVDTSYQATLLDYKGFGGKLSTTTMYDSALNPDAVYKNYLAGPEPITSLSGWISNFFAIPSINVSVK